MGCLDKPEIGTVGRGVKPRMRAKLSFNGAFFQSLNKARRPNLTSQADAPRALTLQRTEVCFHFLTDEN
jgi:hypothetical protein